MVDVSIDILHKVKYALSDFQSDISGLAQRARKNADDITINCENSIGETQLTIANIEAKLNALTKQITDLEDIITQATNKYDSLLARIPKIQNQIRSLDSMITSLNAQISSLRSHLSNTEDDNQKKQIQQQIDALSNQLYKCQTQRHALEDELRNSEKQRDALRQTINSAKAKRTECENERSCQKNRCYKFKDKLDRLESAFDRIKSELDMYLAATGRFESNTAEKTRAHTGSIEKCIASIEAYLATSL